MTSVSCASSVSEHKPSPKSQADNRSKSCDTNCTSNSSCFFKRRKPMNPLAYSMLRPAGHKPNNPVKQRVMSAKLLKLRQLQSQLNDSNFHLAEVARENQTLKTLQKRQDKALSKYENTNADLPRLIHSHEEEIRVLTEKTKTLRKTVRDLAEQLKQRDDELGKAREQLAHLEKLDKDKHLTEREKLTDRMEDIKLKLHKSEEQVTILNRKLMLENKTSKQRLNAEILRHKQSQKELVHAFDEIDRLTGLLDVKENMIRPRNPKFTKVQTKESIPMGTLINQYHPKRNLSNDKLNTQTPVTDVKLEPIGNGISGKEVENVNRKNQNGFKAPMENIRQRLSSSSIGIPRDTNGSSNHSTNISTESRDTSAGSFKSRPNSSLKLEKLPSVQENQGIRTKMKPEDNINKEKGEREQEERNVEVKKDDNRSDGEEYIEDKDVIVRYDSENDRAPEMSNGIIIRDKINEGNIPHSPDQSGNNSEEDLEDLIHKMKKQKQEEAKILATSHNYKRKSSDETSTTGSLQSEKDLEIMAENFDVAIQKATQNSKDDFDKNLSTYCSDVLSNVKSCSKVIGAHKESLKNSKKDTDTLLVTFQNTEKNENKLKKSFFNMEDDLDFVNEILNEEYNFQKENKIHKTTKRDKNSNIDKNSLVNLDSKKKLLATLRAIDNGDSVESIEGPKQGHIIKEIFGNVAH